MVVGDRQLSKAIPDNSKSVEKSKRSGDDVVNSLMLTKVCNIAGCPDHDVFAISRVF